MRKTTILPILFLFILLTTSIATAIGEEKVLWVTSDAHVDHPMEVHHGWKMYYTIVNDTLNNLSKPDIYLTAGDNVDGTKSLYWELFNKIFNTTEVTTYKNYSIGNHENYEDGDWETYASGGADHNNYTYLWGNILFIVIGDNEVGFGDGDYRQSYPTLNTTVQANQDKNIIVICHHPLENTTNNTWNNYDNMDITKGGADCLWLVKNYNISMWISGHNHLPGNYTKTSNFIYGTLFMNAGTGHLGGDGNTAKDYFANWGGSTRPKTSSFINFTEGSTRVSIQKRNHNTSSWFPEQYLNVTLGDRWNNGSWLDFPFVLGTTPTIENNTVTNQSINVNVSYYNVTVNDTDGDTFNWTIQLSNGNESWGNTSSNGTIACQMNLSQDTNYTVWVNITDDGVTWQNETFWFTSLSSGLLLEAIIIKSTYDEVGIGNSIFSIIGLVLIIGAILSIIGTVYFLKRE